MSIEAATTRHYYDQDGNHVDESWPGEHRMPRISAILHGIHGTVTIVYDLIYTGKR